MFSGSRLKAAMMKLNLRSTMTADAGGDAAARAEEAVGKQVQTKPVGPGFVKTVTTLVQMPPFLCLCFAYIPVMVIRISLANWSAVIFQDRKMSMFEAGACMSALEIGGTRRQPAFCCFRRFLEI